MNRSIVGVAIVTVALGACGPHVAVDGRTYGSCDAAMLALPQSGVAERLQRQPKRVTWIYSDGFVTTLDGRGPECQLLDSADKPVGVPAAPPVAPPR